MAREFESVKRVYTDKEMAEMNDALVQSVGEVKTLRGEKKQADSTLGAAIKTAEKTVFDLQEKLSQGYELVEVEVMALMNEPEPGRKQIIRIDTSQVLRVEMMTPRELQQSLFEDRAE
jgi:hypothetical protein